MNSNELNKIWKSQKHDFFPTPSRLIIKKAKKQRNRQVIGIAVMSTTIIIILLFTIKFANNRWNNFTMGLVMMFSSLIFRVLLELFTLHRKENQLITLNSLSFYTYLKGYYKSRKIINYIVTPLCFVIYTVGFVMLLPYFKRQFTNGFYTYILISGITSLFVIALIIINSIKKEKRFIDDLQKK